MSLESKEIVADNELDDFFAKKDKKGKKKKKNQAKDTGSIATESKTKKENFGVEQETAAIENTIEDEEWNDFKEEVKDYSDLRIQNLQIVEEPPAPVEEEREYNDAGELMPPKSDEGPWNKKSNNPVQTESSNLPTSIESNRTTASVGAYRPPSLRSGEAYSFRHSKRKQQAPEISNTMDFPSLATAAEDKEPGKGFQVVKSGSSMASSSQPWRSRRQQQGGERVSIGNKFSALSSNRY